MPKVEKFPKEKLADYEEKLSSAQKIRQLFNLFYDFPPELQTLFLKEALLLETALESSIVALLNKLGKVTMFGRQIHDSFPDPSIKVRSQYDIHPYSKEGSGVSATLAYTNKHTGEIYLLLCKKKKAMKPEDQYDQIGGYTKGVGPEGSERQVVAKKLTGDKRDALEEAMIGHEDAINVDKTEETSNIPEMSCSLLELSQAVRAIYQELLKKNGPDYAVDPIEMKKQLKEKYGIEIKAEINAEETALNEVKQETGLDFLGKLRPKRLSTPNENDYGISNEDARLHTKVSHYLFDLGELDETPEVVPGSDVGLLEWIRASDLQLANPTKTDQRSTVHDVPIRLDYGTQTLTAAIKKVREKQLQEASKTKAGNPRYSKTENVEAALEDRLLSFDTEDSSENVLENFFGKRPVSQFGESATLYYAKILETARYLSKNPLSFDLNVLLAKLETVEKQMQSSDQHNHLTLRRTS